MYQMILVLSSEEACRFLNGDQSVLVRKIKPKKLPCECNIYVAKARPYLVRGNGLADYLAKECDKNFVPKPKKFELYNFEDKGYSAEFYDFFNGKVVARFWCDMVAGIVNFPSGYETYVSGAFPNIKVMKEEELLKLSCLTREELKKYLPCDKERTGYAIHIKPNSLKIFDKPKELKEFEHQVTYINVYTDEKRYLREPLRKAPRSGWCYVEN